MALIIFLILLGTVLVFLETCLVGGVLGVAGAGCYGWAVWLAWNSFGIFGAICTSAVCSAGVFGALVFWIYVVPKTPLGKKIFLTSSENGVSPSADFSSLVGRKATALTKMIPSGKVEIDGIPFDAKSFSSTEIKKGDCVRVVSADSFGLRVEAVEK